MCKSLRLRHAPDTARTCNLQFRSLFPFLEKLHIWTVSLQGSIIDINQNRAKLALRPVTDTGGDLWLVTTSLDGLLLALS